MCEEKLVPAGNASVSQKDFVKVQYEQAIDTYRSEFALLTQVITVLVIANATVVGIAVSNQIAGILFVGAIFPIVIFAILKIVFSLSLPIIYTAINLEQKWGNVNNKSEDWLLSTFVASSISSEYLNNLISITHIEDQAERIKMLKRISPPSFDSRWSGFVKFALLVVFIGQMILPFFLSYYFGWRLF